MAVPVMIAATVVAAYGAYEQGQAQKGMYEYQAGVARNNALLAARNAQSATERGEVLVQTKEQQTAQTTASYRAKTGGAGIDVTTGSPANIQGDIAGLGELDALTIRNNAAREAYGYKVAQGSFSSEAAANMVAGRNAAVTGELGAFSSILGGAAATSNKWNRMRMSGADPWSF